MFFRTTWNAFVGWITMMVGKRVLRKKAVRAVQRLEDPKTGGAIAGTLAALGGALFIWRKKRGGEAASA